MRLLSTLRSALGVSGSDTDNNTTEDEDAFDVAGFRAELREQYATKTVQGRTFPLVPEDELTLGVFPRDNAWGNKVTPTEQEDGRIQSVRGHATVMTDEMQDIASRPNVTFNSGRQVAVGDTFGYQTESGRVQVYVVTDVDHADDPDDMFWASVTGAGYVEGTI